MNELIIDIIKSTLPALIVFFTVFYLFKSWMRHQWHLSQLEIQKKNGQQSFPLKLQAYERLVLFCERISIDNLIYRINQTNMNGKELQHALLIAIQQEFEHNLTQQIYVSENLWKIIRLTKDQMQAVISETEGETNAAFIQNVYPKMSTLQPHPLDYARIAIKKETDILLS